MPYEEYVKLIDQIPLQNERLERLLQLEQAVRGPLSMEQQETVRLLAMAGLGGSY
jgi:hypothetical protein